jgi:hypothetical protein
MKRLWRIVAAVLILGAAAAGVYWWLLPKGTDEQQVQDVIVRMGEAVEQKNVHGCMSFVSEGYHDSIGNTRTSLTRLAIDAFHTVGDITVASYDPKIDVANDEATASVRVRVEYTISGRREKTELMLTLKLQREGWLRKWRITNAEGWQREAEGGLGDYL